MMPDTQLLQTISPDVKTIIWAHDSHLSENIPHFYSMDYLLDGLVRRHLEEDQRWDQVTFVHTLFGKNFWVSFVNPSATSLPQYLESIKSLIPEDQREKMVILNEKVLPADWQKSLDKAFKFVEKI